MWKKIQLLLICAVFLFMLCTKSEDLVGRTNPFDNGGSNYFPPKVFVMPDTTVFIDDSVYIHASATDANGIVNRYLWAKDGKHFLDTTNSNQLYIRFTTSGMDTILVSAIDTNGMKANVDTIIVTVRLGRPTISVTPDSAVVATGDSLTLTASTYDTNGIIKAIYWATDGKNFSYFQTTPGNKTITVAYQSSGRKTILVKAIDDDSLAAYDSAFITVRDPSPLIFAPVTNAQLVSNSATLQWQSGLYNDHFQVFMDTVNPPIAFVNYSTHDTFNVVSNMVYNKSYWWKVIGYNASGLQASSAIWKFTTSQKPPDKPVLSATNIDTTAIAVQWNKISGATSYILQSASASTGPFTQLYSGNDTTYSQTGIAKNKNIWYRVQALNTIQSSQWSDTVMAVIVSFAGTWVGTWQWIGPTTTGCNAIDSGSFSMTLIQNGNSFSGSTSGAGVQNLNSGDCSLSNYSVETGTDSCTISGTTLNLFFELGGGNMSFTGVATLNNDTLKAVFIRSTGGQGSFALTRLF